MILKKMDPRAHMPPPWGNIHVISDVMVITLRDVTLCCQPLMLLKCMLLLGGVLWCLSARADQSGARTHTRHSGEMIFGITLIYAYRQPSNR